MPKLLAERSSSMAASLLREVDPDQLAGHLEFSLPDAVESWRYCLVKRSLDVVFSAVLIALFAVPGVLIALAVRMTSEGPAFYRETRIGRNGRPFRIWKFRSMRRDAPKHAPTVEVHHSSNGVLEWRMHKRHADPRITPIGRFLRRWSLDELPQLLNVVRGEMSLVGPRPIVAAETRFYGDLFDYYLAVTPGLSGLWQVSGRSDIDYPLRVRLDAVYVGTWSLRSDLAILLRTVPAVFGRRGAR